MPHVVPTNNLFLCTASPTEVRVLCAVLAAVWTPESADLYEETGYLTTKHGHVSEASMKHNGWVVLSRWEIDVVDYASDTENVHVVHEILPK